MALASCNTGSCPASLEISTSRAICGSTHCQSALPVTDGHLADVAWKMEEGGVSWSCSSPFPTQTTALFAYVTLTTLCTRGWQAVSQRSYPSLMLLKRSKRPPTRLKPWWTMKRPRTLSNGCFDLGGVAVQSITNMAELANERDATSLI